MRRRLEVTLLLLLLGLCIGLLLPGKVEAACHPIPITWYSPTGVAGCEVYGEGLASFWGGPGVARNDCLWPWTDCQMVRVTSLSTGLSVVLTPSMYCDCYTGTSEQRIVDLDPSSLKALGLWDHREQGLFSVEVQPLITLPDTSMR